MSPPDERIRFFVDQVSSVAGSRIDFDHSKSLMTAIGFLIRERVTVIVPSQARTAKIDATDLRLDLLFGFDVK
jgi:phenylalanyl-tRNA synthetase beta subunit